MRLRKIIISSAVDIAPRSQRPEGRKWKHVDLHWQQQNEDGSI